MLSGEREENQYYSRQIGTYGKEAMALIRNLRVKVRNLNSVGCETVKNLVLSGIHTVILEDPRMPRPRDYGRIMALPAGQDRSMAIDQSCAEYFRQMNPHVRVLVHGVDADAKKPFDVLVVCGEEETWSEERGSCWFIGADIKGTQGVLWQSMGSCCRHRVWDVDGESNPTYLCVSCQENQVILDAPHPLIEAGDFVEGHKEPVVKVQGNTLFFLSGSSSSPFKPGDYIRRKPRVAEIVDLPFQRYTADTVIGQDISLPTYWTTKDDTEWYPLAAVMGGIVAQEVLKKTGKYLPLVGLTTLSFGPPPVVPRYEVMEEEEDRYYDCRKILGAEGFARLREQKVFLVGAGALGCEALKNAAMLGMGTGERGKIVVTDMDRIELSNLNRQFLYRKSDLQQFKSETACAKIALMNPACQLEYHTVAVGTKTESLPFDDLFWDSIDLVINALDNVEARRYVDAQCRWFRKPLWESGTLGTKCNLQTILPDQTETYSDSVDPPEKEIPVCTIKTFPYLIDHCIEWALEIFSAAIPSQRDQDDMEIEFLFSGLDICAGHPDEIEKHLMVWSEMFLQRVARTSIDTLLRLHPVDALEKDGTLFWSGTRRVPRLIETRDRVFVEAHVQLLRQLQRIFMEAIPVEPFDKDNLEKGHLDCVLALTNLRATVYDIPVTDLMTCQRIAGKITPAVCCATAMIMGRVFLGVTSSNSPRNVFANLALNLFVESEPLKPVAIRSGHDPVLQTEIIVINEGHTCWDRLELDLDQCGKTLMDLIRYMERTYHTSVTAVLGRSDRVVYSEFMNEENLVDQELLPGSQWQVEGEDDDGKPMIFPIIRIRMTSKPDCTEDIPGGC